VVRGSYASLCQIFPKLVKHFLRLRLLRFKMAVTAVLKNQNTVVSQIPFDLFRQNFTHLDQGVYKFNRTNFQELSRRFQEGCQEKSRTCLHCFDLLCNVPNLLHLMEHVRVSFNRRSSLCNSTDYNICYTSHETGPNIRPCY